MPDKDDNHLPVTSEDVAARRLRAIMDIAPDAFSEGKLDVERLKAALGDEPVVSGPERYELVWAGKKGARQAVRSVSNGTLLPVREESVEFDSTGNVIIQGDNLNVLKLLQTSYQGRVKMIYIDPPYNTGGEFIYPDRFQAGLRDYLRYSGQVAEEGVRLTASTESAGRFHSAWLSMMYPRLFLARNMLANDGFIAVSIGNEEVASLRLLMNEVFGEENHRNTIAVRRYDKNLSQQFVERGLTSLAVGFEYVLVYSRDVSATMNPVLREASTERQAKGYWKGFHNSPNRPTMRYPLFGYAPESGQWKWKEDVAAQAVANYEKFLAEGSGSSLEEYWEQTGCKLKFIRKNPSGRAMNRGVEHWIPPSSGILRTSNWTDLLASEAIDLPFDNPKHPRLLTQLILMLADEDALILDFFAGSGTTAQAVLELNSKDNGSRSFVLVQLPEPTPEGSAARKAGFATIADVCKERVQRAIERLNHAGSGRVGMSDADEVVADRGFKFFRLSSSNFKMWDADETPGDAEALVAELRLYADNLVAGRQQEDLLYEILLKAGLPLTAKVEMARVGGQRAFSVGGGTLVVCLEDPIQEDTLRGVLSVTPAPAQVICLDRSFAGNDTLKTNIRLEMRSHGIQFRTV